MMDKDKAVTLIAAYGASMCDEGAQGGDVPKNMRARTVRAAKALYEALAGKRPDANTLLKLIDC